MNLRPDRAAAMRYASSQHYRAHRLQQHGGALRFIRESALGMSHQTTVDSDLATRCASRREMLARNTKTQPLTRKSVSRCLSPQTGKIERWILTRGFSGASREYQGSQDIACTTAEPRVKSTQGDLQHQGIAHRTDAKYFRRSQILPSALSRIAHVLASTTPASSSEVTSSNPALRSMARTTSLSLTFIWQP